jgi:hypothetical protein
MNLKLEFCYAGKIIMMVENKSYAGFIGTDTSCGKRNEILYNHEYLRLLAEVHCKITVLS